MISARKLTGTGRCITRMGAPAQFEEGLHEVAPQTYAWMVPNGSWGETNLGLVTCGGRSVLIDTCWDLVCEKEMQRHAEPAREQRQTLLSNRLAHRIGDRQRVNRPAMEPLVAQVETRRALAQLEQRPAIFA